MPVRAGHERSRTSRALRLGELERAIDPAVDQLGVRALLPHARPDCRMEGEQGVGLRARRPIGRELERALHRPPQRLPVVLERVNAADLPPDLRSLDIARLELERAME